MKLIMAVIQDNDAGRLMEALSRKKFGLTRLASTGGFLRSGNTTLMIGAEDERVDELLSIIKKTCKPRKKIVTPLPAGPADAYVPYPVEVTVGGATLFILDVERFVKV